MLMHHLFLSHAGIDSDAALALGQRLEEAAKASGEELAVWIDKRDLGHGPWLDQIDTAFKGSTAFAVYVGTRGVINWVWREVKLALDRTIVEPAYRLLPILADGARPEGLPSFLSQFQCFADAGIAEPAFGKLLAAVLGKGPRTELARVSDPFVGLRAFDSSKAHLFFGRERKVAELVELLRTEHLVMVVGDSGSGKSSLVKAGLVPAFRGGRLARPRDQGPDETIWHVVETRPRHGPVRPARR
jgi:TIR domain